MTHILKSLNRESVELIILATVYLGALTYFYINIGFIVEPGLAWLFFVLLLVVPYQLFPTFKNFKMLVCVFMIFLFAPRVGNQIDFVGYNTAQNTFFYDTTDMGELAELCDNKVGTSDKDNLKTCFAYMVNFNEDIDPPPSFLGYSLYNFSAVANQLDACKKALISQELLKIKKYCHRSVVKKLIEQKEDQKLADEFKQLEVETTKQQGK